MLHCMLQSMMRNRLILLVSYVTLTSQAGSSTLGISGVTLLDPAPSWLMNLPGVTPTPATPAGRPPAKRGPAAVDEMAVFREHLQQVAMLSLSSAQQVRALNAGVMTNIRLSSDGEFVTEGLRAAKAFAESAKKIQQEHKGTDAQEMVYKTLGTPDFHIFNALLKVSLGKVSKDSPQETALTDFVKNMDSISNTKDKWDQLAKLVGIMKIQKTFNRQHKRLQVHLAMNTEIQAVWDVIMEQLALDPQYKIMVGVAPRGANERAVQDLVDKLREQ